ncbi:Mu-like prophage protein gp29 [Roseivivax halotolerans]|uniref:Mu-like prophage protein gp29 n=1 Tax=Roseivivax halotolerans TaxID=93684 RepID=A0A1I5W3B9_9RHOB|nr:DUF935 domain-containing protein [Roseivivax halotolerans]SFQ14254.1 Mu-like prophage protein gp29 [Roseivivax halotolerans]
MSQLLDQNGQPVRRKELLEMQSEPRLAGIRNAFAETVAAGLTPQKLANILRACDQGEITEFVTLAEEIEERDPHYFSVLGTRKRAVSGVAPRVEPAGEDAASRRIAEAVNERIAEHEEFPDLVEDLLDALGKGFSLVEIDWHRSGREWWPGSFRHVDPRFVIFDRETGREMRLIDDEDPANGIPLTPLGFIQHRAKLKSGLTFRGGMARVAAFSWMCKAYTLKDWTAFVETYGLPLRLGRYDAGATKKDQEMLLRAVANIGTDAAAILPKSMEIDFTETKATGGDKVFENLARYVDEQISKAVLGQTMTSDNGSSQAQAKVHNEVRHDIAQADARGVTGSINRDLVRPFVDLNFGRPADGQYPRLVIQIEEAEDTDKVMQNVHRMARLGTRFSQADVRSRLGFAEPDPKEEIIGGPRKSARSQPTEEIARNAAETPFDDLDLLEREMSEDWEPVIRPMADPIDAAIETAESFEDALAKLEALRPEMSSAELIDRLVKGMVKARGLGDARDD